MLRLRQTCRTCDAPIIFRCHGYNLAPRQTRRLVESARLGTSCAPPTPRVSLCPAGPLRGSRQRPRFWSRISCFDRAAVALDRTRLRPLPLFAALARIALAATAALVVTVHITAFADVAIAPRRRPAPPSCAQRGLPPQETVFFLPSLGGFVFVGHCWPGLFGPVGPWLSPFCNCRRGETPCPLSEIPFTRCLFWRTGVADFEGP